MPDLDPQVGELLDRRTPPVKVEPRWDDVLRRAELEAGAERRPMLRLPRRRWLLLAAVLAVPVGIAAAQAHRVFVHYLSGGASTKQRDQIRSSAHAGHYFNLTHGHIRADLHRARRLVSVSLGGHHHVFLMAPLTHGSGGCFFEIVDGRQIVDSECGYDPKARHPVVSGRRVVGAGTALGAQVFQVGAKPVWVVIGVMPAAREVSSVRVRFQDGTSARAPTNGPFFSYVVSGAHSRANRRPTALVGLTDGGKVGATQLLDPQTFNAAATYPLHPLNTRRRAVLYLILRARRSLPARGLHAEARVSTTPGKVARMFGGSARMYPPHPVVVVLRGPFTISTIRRTCSSTPRVCPVPKGRWAYFAYLINPDEYRYNTLPGKAIVWLRKAPVGAPYPDLSRLGHVFHDRRVLTVRAKRVQPPA